MLDADITALARDDVRRVAWLNVDRYSAVWVRVWPSQDLRTSDSEFMETPARYFGLPSQACVQGQLWQHSPTTGLYGFNLCAASLPGGCFRDVHDALKWQLLEDLREMHVRSNVLGLFAPILPQRAKEHFETYGKEAVEDCPGNASGMQAGALMSRHVRR